MSKTNIPKLAYSDSLDDEYLNMFGDIDPTVSVPEIEVSDLNMGNMLGDIDLKGMGTIASVLGSLWSVSEDKKYKDEMLAREDERIARDRAKQDKFDADMQKAYK